MKNRMALAVALLAILFLAQAPWNRVFAVDPPASFDIYVVDVKTGSTQRVTFITDGDEYNPTFSNDGKYIAHDVVSMSDPLGQSIYVTDISTGISSPLVGAEGGNDASWSPNGKLIVFDRNSDLYTVPAGGGTPALVRTGAVDGEWSNNSKRLVFRDVTDGSLRTVDINGGTETTVTTFGVNPSWSPNGKAIAYSDGSDIFTIAIDQFGEPQGSPQQLTAAAGGVFYQQPSWSNSGKTIVFHSNRETGDVDIWTIPAAGATPTLLAGDPDYGDYDPCFSKNGRYVAYAGFTHETSSAALPSEKTGSPSIKGVSSVPNQFGLMQNFPNPFNPSTTIQYALPADAHVTLEVYDMLGRRVAQLVNGQVAEGNHNVTFDASGLASGTYMYRLEANEGDGKVFTQIKRFVLLK